MDLQALRGMGWGAPSLRALLDDDVREAAGGVPAGEPVEAVAVMGGGPRVLAVTSRGMFGVFWRSLHSCHSGVPTAREC